MTARPLEIVSASALMTAMLAERPWYVEGLLTSGVTLLVGDPKVGKSWLVLDLLRCLSSGEALWGCATRRVDVLYLALEDTLPRLQQRLWRLADEASEGYRIALTAGTIDDGLLDQLEGHLDAYPATRVIAVDTLRLVRGSSATSSSVYASEYADVHRLKELADAREIAIILVHHTRKMGDADVFKLVSGSQGLMGAADQTMVLRRDDRADATATLSVTGRDVEYCELVLRFEDCRWALVERLGEREIAERKAPPEMSEIIELVEAIGSWRGTATELAELITCDVTPPALAKRLAEHRRYLAERGVRVDRTRTSSARLILLRWEPPADA